MSDKFKENPEPLTATLRGSSDFARMWMGILPAWFGFICHFSKKFSPQMNKGCSQ